MALTNEGWTIWTRSGSEVQISKATHPTNASIQAELDAHSNPIAFLCGDEWDDIALSDTRGRDYIAWYGTPANGRPKLNVASPDNTVGLLISPENNDFDIQIIGLEFDGRRTGQESDDWRGKGRDCIRGFFRQDRTGNLDILIEDCYCHHTDRQIAMVDQAPCVNGGVGQIAGTIRRCLCRYADSRDSHGVNVYIEGTHDAPYFVIEQCSIDKAGYYVSRNEDSPYNPGNPNANKREHNIYVQECGDKVYVRECFLTNSAANAAQLRLGGEFKYNACSRNGMTLFSRLQFCTAIGNVWADREDISTAEPRGTGMQVYGQSDIQENIFYRPRHSAQHEKIIESGPDPYVTMANNASFNWGISQANGGRGFFMIDEVDQNGVNGNSAVSNYPDYGFNDLSWPEDAEADINTRFSRGLGEWRPTIDHPGDFINSVRALADANSGASLPEVFFGNNGATSVGSGGLSGSPSTSLPTAFLVDDDVAVQLPAGAFLQGYGTDAAGQSLTYAWSHVSGPATAQFATPSSPQTIAIFPTDGVYTVRLTVTNEDLNSDTADGTVTVSAAANVAPTVTVPVSVQVQLPTSTIQLAASADDSDGTIASYAWTQIAGPNTATLANETTATVDVSNMITGTYQFRCTVTDNDTATASDDVFVEVMPATITIKRTGRYRSRRRGEFQ